MILQRVSLAVAINKWQDPEWWGPLFRSLLKRQGTEFLLHGPITYGSTDIGHNRSLCTRDFLASDSEWLWFVDDDTLPDDQALPMLLALEEPFCAGLYFYKSPGKNYAPLMYKRVEVGRYAQVLDYQRGEILTVDGVGMGCTLIHRQVFEDIAKRTLIGLDRDDGHTELVAMNAPQRIKKNFKLGEIEKYRKHEHLPFFVTAGTRTEDFYFCELAELAGYKPRVDTMIECDHLYKGRRGGTDFRDLRKMRRGQVQEARTVGQLQVVVL